MTDSTLAWDLTKRYLRHMVRSPALYIGLVVATAGEIALQHQKHHEKAPKQEIKTDTETNPIFETIKEGFVENLHLLDKPRSKRLVDSPVEPHYFVPATKNETFKM